MARTTKAAFSGGVAADGPGERRDVAGFGKGSAVGNLGAAARRPLRTRRRLARQVESDGSPGAGAPGAPVPRRVRACLATRPFELGGAAGGNTSARGRAASPPQGPR